MAEQAARNPNYHVIDPHVHVWRHDPQFPFAVGAHIPARDAAPETLLGLMRANGVQRTVIIQVIHYRYDNRYLASVLNQYPQYFKGVARVDPLDPHRPIIFHGWWRKTGLEACGSVPAPTLPEIGLTGR